MKTIQRLAAALLLFASAIAQPGHLMDEPLEDPEAEAKVQAVAETLRCVVCKNQSIAESDAGLAKDMVALIRDKIDQGATEEEARAFLVESYGDFVLMKPRFSWGNAGLWFGPFVMLAIGGMLAGYFVRTRKVGESETVPAMTEEERIELERRLEALQGEEQRPDHSA